MRKLLLLIGILGLFIVPIRAQSTPQAIPDTLTFCEHTLLLTEDARERLSELVEEIQVNGRYYNQLLGRAYLYMPIIEEALAYVGVPDDFKYLAILESALQPSTVSTTSNAVGFWQFKEETGREMGLLIDSRIDERKHIFRSSVAAAHYLAQASDNFKGNWLYGMLAYNLGFTGSLPFTKSRYYGQKEMEIDSDIHPYLMKVLAHYIAYSPALVQPYPMEICLLPYSTAGETSIEALMALHNLPPDKFTIYNQWLLDTKRLPRTDRPFTYYVPTSPEACVPHKEDPNKGLGALLASVVDEGGDEDGMDTLAAVTPESPVAPTTSSQSAAFPPAKPPSILRSGVYAAFPLQADLEYGAEYIAYNRKRPLAMISRQYGIPYEYLLTWNQLTATTRPAEGYLVYLKKPTKSAYHVVQPGESLADVAAIHRKSIRKIQRLNRMSARQTTILEGQKLYLRSKKPKREKIIVLFDLINVPDTPQETAYIPLPAVDVSASADSLEVIKPVVEEPIAPVMPDREFWIAHTVQKGETLWKLSQYYQISVENLKQTNGLTSDGIQVGQTLQVLVKSSVLEQLANGAR